MNNKPLQTAIAVSITGASVRVVRATTAVIGSVRAIAVPILEHSLTKVLAAISAGTVAMAPTYAHPVYSVKAPRISVAAAIQPNYPLYDSTFKASDSITLHPEKTFFDISRTSDGIAISVVRVMEDTSFRASDAISRKDVGRSNFDTGYFSDSTYRFTYKVLADTVSISDAANVLVPGKSFDQSNISDLEQTWPTKVINEGYWELSYLAEDYAYPGNVARITDVRYFGFNLNPSDTPSVAEYLYRDMSKALFDNPIVQDDFDGNASTLDAPEVLVSKVVQETARTSDTRYLDIGLVPNDSYSDDDYAVFGYWAVKTAVFGSDFYTISSIKVLADTSTFADAKVADFTKVLKDTSTVTDDSDGVATANDDQTNSFFKNTADSSQVSDTFARQFIVYRSVDEVPSVAEYSYRGITLGKFETPTVAESKALAPSLVKADTSQTSDTRYIDYSLVQYPVYARDYFSELYVIEGDVADVNDAVVLGVDLGSRDETTTATDASVLSVSRQSTDSASTSDTEYLGIAPAKFDTAQLSDNDVYQYDMTVIEAYALSYFAETYAKMDNIASVTDVGVVVSQNYTLDNSYFLEGFVGEARTF
jgi:hypothetical protein